MYHRSDGDVMCQFCQLPKENRVHTIAAPEAALELARKMNGDGRVTVTMADQTAGRGSIQVTTQFLDGHTLGATSWTWHMDADDDGFTVTGFTAEIAPSRWDLDVARQAVDDWLPRLNRHIHLDELSATDSGGIRMRVHALNGLDLSIYWRRLLYLGDVFLGTKPYGIDPSTIDEGRSW